MRPFKRGDTLAFYASLKDSEGAYLDYDVSKMKCQLRTRQGKLVDTLNITKTETTGKYLVRATDTTKYPIEKLYSDIEITDNDITTSSSTFEIEIKRDYTYE